MTINRDIITNSVEIEISGVKIAKDSVVIINDAGFILKVFRKDQAIDKLMKD